MKAIFDPDRKNDTVDGGTVVLRRMWDYLNCDGLLLSAGIRKRSGIPTSCLAFNYVLMPLMDAGSIKRTNERTRADELLKRLVPVSARLLACEYGAIAIHPDKKSILICDLCEGEPKCLEWCPENALDLLTKTELNHMLSLLPPKNLFQKLKVENMVWEHLEKMCYKPKKKKKSKQEDSLKNVEAFLEGIKKRRK